MNANELRRKYIDFFVSKGHVEIPSASLVPENDPTTLFTGSGMQPMVSFLLGEQHPSGSRIVDSQKCFRSGDIEEVGDNRHTTFFEMLGNWSLGDYFKKEQIPWMYAFLVKELQLDPTRLYITVFRGNDQIARDEVSAQLWQEQFSADGVDNEIVDFGERDGMQGGRIFYYDEKKNWWSRSGVPSNMPVGEPGGPDCEMFWDFGTEHGLHERSQWKDQPCHVNCDCGRFMEIGNNVFMEYRKTEDGFQPLPKKNVDFGGGLERLIAALQDTPDVFKTDLFDSARKTIEEIIGKRYDENENDKPAFRVILDHIRAATFLIGDGVLPSNKDQGYFVRRLIRRSVRLARRLSAQAIVEQAQITHAVADTYISYFQDVYPQLAEKREFILTAIDGEEKKFKKTLEKGLRQFEKLYKEKRAVTGVDAFDLYQTYGFPLELTEELAREEGQVIDRDMFKGEFEKHKNVSRAGSEQKFKGGLADTSEKTTQLHTATHLMLAALRKYLGSEVHQAGSNITAERTRFDFTWSEKVGRETLDKVEEYVNEAIGNESTVTITVMPKEQAQVEGVEGSFWEKYPADVNVYSVVGKDGTVYSKELCGGPHVEKTTGMGTFKIIKEESSSAGVRRIKAILEE